MAEKVHGLALELGGTVSTQHGTGLARTPWVARQYGPLYPVLRQLKAIFDPKNIFNPGKIVDPDASLAPAAACEPLRGPGGDPAQARLVSQTLSRQKRRIATAAANAGPKRRSNGCARSSAPRTPRPPRRGPRQICCANLLQQQANGLQLSAEEVREVADLCVNCKMCAIECPAHVNIPKLMLEAKAANVAEHGMDVTRLVLFARWKTCWAGAARLRSWPTLPCAAGQRAGCSNDSSACRRPGACRASRPHVSWLAPSGAAGRTSRTELGRSSSTSSICSPTTSIRRSPRRRSPSCSTRLRRVRPAGSARQRHGGAGAWRRRGGTRNRPAESACARRTGPRRLADLCSEPTAAVMLRHDYLDLQNDDDARAVAEQDRRADRLPLASCTSKAGCAPISARSTQRRPSCAVPCQGARAARSPGRACWR